MHATREPEKVAEHLQRIDQHVGMADGVITALSNFAKMPLPDLRPFVVDRCVREALDANPLPSSVQIELDLPPSLPAALGDIDQLRIVFANLIRNARDAMPQGGRLTVRGRQAGIFLEVAVSDTGTGIAARQPEPGHGAFVLHQGPGSRVGIGAGESHCRQEQGYIDRCKRVGAWQHFYRAATHGTLNGGLNHVCRAPRILVVDDETDICRNLVDIFVDFGFCVDMANDGESALALVQKQRYDLALVDLMMPGMDGATLYDRMKKLRTETVALIVTAYPGHPRAEAALAAGAWKVLPKPVDIASLIQMIQQTVAQPLLLMVDDDTDFCANLWEILRGHGYRTCVAHDIATANKFMDADEGYSLILLDVRLPDGDGGQVIRSVHRKNPAMPIVVITGYRTEIEQQIPQLLSEGGKAVLPKPLNVPALLATLHELTDE